jgi:hypothetical protein
MLEENRNEGIEMLLQGEFDIEKKFPLLWKGIDKNQSSNIVIVYSKPSHRQIMISAIDKLEDDKNMYARIEGPVEGQTSIVYAPKQGIVRVYYLIPPGYIPSLHQIGQQKGYIILLGFDKSEKLSEKEQLFSKQIITKLGVPMMFSAANAEISYCCNDFWVNKENLSDTKFDILEDVSPNQN